MTEWTSISLVNTLWTNRVKILLIVFQVDEIEEKLDRLISLYEEDRKRTATMSCPTPRCPPCTPLPSSPSPPYAFVNHPANAWVLGIINFHFQTETRQQNGLLFFTDVWRK